MEPSNDITKSFPDHIKFKGNADICKMLDDNEDIVFSCKLQKRNKWGFNQERQMMLTTKRLYNIADCSKMQRKILVSSVSAISRSTVDGNLEFVVHVKDEYDYQFESADRDEIFEAIKYAYWKVTGKNVPVYMVPSSLENVHSSK